VADRRDPDRPDRRKSSRPGSRRADDPPPDWLSISDFAKRYGIDRGTVYKWLRAQLLDVYRVDTLLRIRNLPPDQHAAQKQRPNLDPPVERC
jgi:hypothetical protein